MFRIQLKTGLVLLLLAPLALAQKTIHVPADQTSIQAGINAASTGDTVLISPGTYYENVDFLGKAITVTSAAGAASTIIDGGGKGPVVNFTTGEARSSILSALTIRNGSVGFGKYGVTGYGGVNIGGKASPTILNNIISANACHGITAAGSPLIQGNDITGTLFYAPASPNPLGGCDATNGAGILVQNAAIYGTLYTSPYPVITGNTIENNNTVLSGPNQSGSGIVLYFAGSPVVTSNIIRNNGNANTEAAIDLLDTNNLVLVQNLIYGNTAGVNAAGLQAALTNFNQTPIVGILANNVFANNVAIGKVSASQIELDGDLSPWDMVNNIIVSADALPAVNCGTANNGFPAGPTPLVIDHNDIYNSVGPALGNLCASQAGTYGNISVDPRFTSPSTGDFHLLAGSPAIDAGTTSVLDLPATDLDGKPRTLDSTSQQYPIVDMGPYESAGVADAVPTTLVITPSAYGVATGSSVTLSSHVASASGVPTGTVFLTLDNVTSYIELVDSSGNSSALFPPLSAGLHTFSGAFIGQFSAINAPPAVAVKVFVLASGGAPTFTVTCTPASAYPDQLIQLAFTDTSATPDGSVTTAFNGTTSAPVPISGGTGSSTFGPLPIGSDVLTSTFTPSVGSATQTASCTVVVTGRPTTTSLTYSPSLPQAGQPVILNASVLTAAGAPVSGTVTFTGANGLYLGSAALSSSGLATLITSSLPSGTSAVTGSYPGSSLYAASAASAQITLSSASTSTVLSVSPTHTTGFQPVTFTAHVTFTPGSPVTTGYVVFTVNQLPVGSLPVDSSGTAVLTVSNLQPGTYTVLATYSGTSTAASSTSAPVILLLDPAPTALTLSASATSAVQNQPITFTSNVTAPGTSVTPSGQITLLDITNPASPVTLSSLTTNPGSTLTFATSALTPGTHLIQATFLPQSAAIFLPASSPLLTITILPQDFVLTAATPTISIQTQHHAPVALTLTSVGGFADTVQLSCANLPIYASCTFSPAAPQLRPGASASVSVTIDTDQVLNFLSLNRSPGSSSLPQLIGLAGLLPVGLVLTLRRSRSHLRRLAAGLIVCVTLTALNGCTSRYPAHTPPGTYILTLSANAASSSLTHTTTLTLVVTP